MYMNNIDPKIFKAYDIRAIYPTQVDEQGGDRIARAIYTFFKKKLGKDSFTVLLAKDMRTSSPVMFEATKKALVEMGANVVDAGLLSTPTFYFAVYHYKYDTGIQITASHNPKEYTGMKFVINSPKGIIKIGKATGMEDVKQMALSDMTFSPASTPGTVTQKTGIGADEVGNPALIGATQVVHVKAERAGDDHLSIRGRQWRGQRVCGCPKGACQGGDAAAPAAPGATIKPRSKEAHHG